MKKAWLILFYCLIFQGPGDIDVTGQGVPDFSINQDLQFFTAGKVCQQTVGQAGNGQHLIICS